MLPSWELTYPLNKALLKMIFRFPRWDMLVTVSSLEGSLPDIKKAAGVLLNQALLNFGLAFLRQRCLLEGREFASLRTSHRQR